MALVKRGINPEDDNQDTKKEQEADVIEKQLLQWRDEYYNKGNSSVSDAVYDNAENRLKQLRPKSKVLTLVGVPEKSCFPKVSHDRAMLSLDKKYTVEEMEKWQEGKDVTGSFKIDGNSLKLYYKEGKLDLAATRGNGKVGADVTPNAKTVRDIPLELPDEYTGEIVGEVYMKNSIFEKHVARIKKDIEFFKAKPDDLPVSARNYASGSLRQEDPKITYERELNFLAYDLSTEKFTLKTKIDLFLKLKELGFEIPVVQKPSDKALTDRIKSLESRRDTIDYDIDGLVFEFNDLEYQKSLGFTRHHPKGKLAFKWKSEEVTSELVDVECKVGRTGRLTFTGIVNPVGLSGATVQRFTLHNFDHIEKNDIRIGDIIRITRSGEVIPKFLKVETHNNGEEIKITQCPDCGAAVVRESHDLVCKNTNCRGQAAQRIVRFIEVAEIEEVGKKNVVKMYDAGLISTAADLYRLKKEDIIKLDKMGSRSSDIIIENIQRRKSLTLSQFLTSLGIKGLGRSAGEVLEENFKDIANIRQLSYSNIDTISGLGNVTAIQIVDGLAKNTGLIDDLLTVVDIKVKQSSGSLNDLSFCVTGKVEFEHNGVAYSKRGQIEKIIKSEGGKIKSVSKELDYLMTDEASSSSKYLKAEKLKIKIISGQEFANKFLPLDFHF